MANDGSPVVTYALMVVTALVFVAQLLLGPVVDESVSYYPPFTAIEPWTMITSLFGHLSFFHIASNMFSLYIFGRILEPHLGRWRFLALYLISGFGGSVAVLLIAPDVSVAGASGAIFGLLGAFFIMQRRLGGNSSQIVILIVLNLAIGFLPGVRIAWQAHVGGLIIGAVVALILVATRDRKQRVLQVVLISGVVVVLIAATVLRYNSLFA